MCSHSLSLTAHLNGRMTYEDSAFVKDPKQEDFHFWSQLQICDPFTLVEVYVTVPL
jgi:hypothetical protein